MNRREFLGVMAFGCGIFSAWAETKQTVIPKRKFGRTGLQVPVLGFGGGSRFLMYEKEDEALAAVEHAIDCGICYLDTAHAYGDGRSEERIGKLMGTRRREVVLATKIPGRTAELAKRQIELSLKRLRTDHVEVLHIHALRDLDDLKAIEAPGGVLEVLYAAREQRVTGAIGITSHASPVGLKAALERHDFDCTQMALNAARANMSENMKPLPSGGQSFETLALPVAARKKLGVIAMKVFGQEHLLGAVPTEKLLGYVLSLPVSLASVGMPRRDHIEQNARLAASLPRMSGKERRRVSELIALPPKIALIEFLKSHEDA